jgi:hypothetical protein
MLADRRDTESQIQCAALRKTQDLLEFVGRDLAGGVIDLRELHFDERTWTLLFKEAVIPLAIEEIELTERAPAPPPPTVAQEDLFDFDSEPSDHGLGIPPDLLDGIDTDQVDFDDTPTLVMEIP